MGLVEIKVEVGGGLGITVLLCSGGWSRQGEGGGWAARAASPSPSMTVCEHQLQRAREKIRARLRVGASPCQMEKSDEGGGSLQCERESVDYASVCGKMI